MAKRIREGVTAAVNEKMDAVDANVLREDGLLLRVCEHGIQHPVGHVSTVIFSRVHACCEALCCEGWGQPLDTPRAEAPADDRRNLVLVPAQEDVDDGA